MSGKTRFRKTMSCKTMSIILVVLASSSTLALAEGVFQGTPEEQKACRRDVIKMCEDVVPDSLRVLACLQAHRPKLSEACNQVLLVHGQ